MKFLVSVIFLSLTLQAADLKERKVSIISTPLGFFPQNLIVFKGEQVSFFYTATSENSPCLVVEDHDLFFPSLKNELVERSLVAKDVGRFKLSCPGHTHTGELVILEDPRLVKKLPARKLASENKIQAWVPSDYAAELNDE